MAGLRFDSACNTCNPHWSNEMVVAELKPGVWKSGRGKGRTTPKGRQLDDKALADVQISTGR